MTEHSSDGHADTRRTDPPVENPSDDDGVRRRNRDQRDACRLFMGNLPKAKTEDDIYAEVAGITSGLVRVITYKNFEDPSLHRGFCFLDYESSTMAAEAKRRLGMYTVFGCKTIVDWADPEPEFDDEMMSTVRILFVRQYGGTLDEPVMAKLFGRFGTVERVKSLKNYAFVHFARREHAEAAMNGLHGTVDAGTGIRIDVSWAKPPTDKQTRERMLRDRERRIQKTVMPGSRHCPLAITGTAPVPYSTYDHYQYDFSRQTLSCQCGRVGTAASPRCQCTCAISATAHPAAADPATAPTPSTVGGYEAKHDHRFDGDESVRQTSSAVQHDHGDCANDSDVDANIINFFYKIMTNGLVKRQSQQ